ncbi:MAG: hypothetical protein RIB78_10935 [Gammaproteobacteria bacterium]
MNFLRKVFNPVLRHFEQDSEGYRPANWKRPLVCILGLILTGLAIAVPWVAPADVRSGAWLPTIVFGFMGFIGLVVGFLGSDHAVAKLLGGR